MTNQNKAKERNEIAEEYYKRIGWIPTEWAVMNFFAGFDAAIEYHKENTPPGFREGLR